MAKAKQLSLPKMKSENLDLLKLMLTKYEFNVLSFRNGEALVNFIQNDPDLAVEPILMDVKMPKMDGIKATEKVKKLKPGIPIVAQTAYALDDDINKIKTADFDDYITKPISQRTLIEKLKKHIY